MTIDEGLLATIRDQLAREPRVDAQAIDLAVADDAVVLRGAVATAEEASAAALLAEQHADAVRNELRVDPNLREDPTAAPAGMDPRTPLQGSSAGSDRPRNSELTVQSSQSTPEPIADDPATRVDEALAENVAWDPPDAPQMAPSPADQRGAHDHDATVPPAEDPGPVDALPGEEPSAGDLSQAELAQQARPTDEDR